MSKIDLHNYEGFYLDYIEENLNAEDTAELLLFLENHSDLKVDLVGFEMVSLDPPVDVSVDFSDLKKEITPANAEEFIIGSIEKQLTDEDEKELAIVISKNSDLKQLSARYSKTILPKSLVEFPEKSGLKKKAGLLVFMTPMMRVAAVGLLLIALYPLLIQEPKIEFADNKKPVTIKAIDSTTTYKNDKALAPLSTKKTIPIIKEDSKLIAQEVKQNPKNESEVILSKNDSRIEPEKRTKYVIESLKPKTFEKVATNTVFETLAINKVDIATQEFPKELIARTETTPQSIGEWLNQNIRKRVFNDPEPKDEKIGGNELLAEATTLLQSKSNTNIAYTHNTSPNSTSYTFTLGKFSFSKTKNN